MALSHGWYLDMDNWHFKVYEALRGQLKKIFLPIPVTQNNLVFAYDALLESLGAGMPVNITNSVNKVNQSLDFLTTYGVSTSLNMFMMGMAGELAYPAQNLRSQFSNYLSQIITHVSMWYPGMSNKISDTCAVKILMKFPNLFEPYVDWTIYSANQSIYVLPEFRANMTIVTKNVTTSVNVLTTKIKTCNKKQTLELKQECADALVRISSQ